MDTLASKPINLIDVTNFFWRWKKHLIMVCGIAILAAVIFSAPYFVKPKFKAVHVFYPTTNNSISNALLTDPNQRQKDPLEFGEEEEAEKALQILQSSLLTSRLVRNFQLMKHYGIDPLKERFPQSTLQSKIDENIGFSRTRYLSIKIEVLDRDPQMAANIANGIAALYDTIKTEIQKQVADPALAIVERALKQKQEKIQGIRDEMRKLGEQGVTNYEEQSRAIAEEIYKAQAAGRHDRAKELLEQQKNLVANGGMFISLNELLKLEEEKESDLMAQLEKRQVDVNESLSHKFTVSSATKPEMKAWPVRWLVVFVTLLFSFIGTSVSLLVYELIKNNKSHQPAT